MGAAELAQVQRANLAVLMLADERRIDDLAVRLQVENVARARVKSRRFAPLDLLRPVLPHVTAPLGGIWGERDATAYPYVEERRDLLRAIQPNALFDIIAGAGHWVMYEAPQAFNRALLTQLAASERAEPVRA
jgi:2-hydroxy-6-oxonona-2,4-dienedioate hydrolase